MIPIIGKPLLSFGLFTFAFTTIIGWSYYGERCVEYLSGKRWLKGYRVIYILTVFIGSVVNLGVVWDIADIMNALMALPNLIALLLLSGVLIRETKKYLWEDRLDEESGEEILEINK